MKTRLAALGLGWTVAACGGAAPLPETPGSPMAMMTPDNPAARGRIVGSVVDLSNRPFPGASVRLCGQSCREFTTDAAGIFEIPEVPSGNYGLRIEQRGATAAEYGKVVIPIYGYDPQSVPVRTLPVTVVPRLGATQPLAAGLQTVAVDAQLSLRLDADSLTLPDGTPRLSGVRVPSTLFPDFCLPGGDVRIVAEWALSPFGATSSTSIDVHIADGLGLPANSSVVLMTVDPETGRPERQGFGKVAADGKSIDSLTSMGVRRLTWLIVTLPGGGA